MEILLNFLDAKSTENLVKVHCSSLNILQCPKAWNNFIRRSCPQLQEGIIDDSITNLSKEVVMTCLAMNHDKVQALSNILDLAKGPQKYEMQMDLLHLLCKKYPGRKKERGVVVKSSCSHRNHLVSVLGFMLLYHCNVDQLQIKSVFIEQLEEPALSAMGKVVNNQKSVVEKLTASVMLLTSQCSDALSILLERSLTLNITSITVNGDIGINGWEVVAKTTKSLKSDYSNPPCVYTWDAGKSKSTREAIIRKELYDWCKNWHAENPEELTEEGEEEEYFAMQL